MHINNPNRTPSFVIVRTMSSAYCHILIDVDLTARQKRLQIFFLYMLNPDSIDVKTTSHEGPDIMCVRIQLEPIDDIPSNVNSIVE